LENLAKTQRKNRLSWRWWLYRVCF